MENIEIKTVIRDYLDACYESNVEKFRGVFHSAAHLYKQNKDGTLIDWDLDAFMEVVGTLYSKTPVPAYPSQDEVLSIDFTDENTAVARVKVRVENTLYTDILCLLRLNGKWSIISKVFTGTALN